MIFSSLPLRLAHRHVMRARRRFLDWDAFIAPGGGYEEHYLVLGTHRNAWDHCCKLALCDQSLAPYPSHSLVRPYLQAITTLQGPAAPVLDDPGLLARASPSYFAGYTKGDLCAVDLDAAYWQVYAPASLDLSYDGETAPRNGRIRFLGSDELLRDKLARNALLGTVRAEWRNDCDHGVLRRVPIPGLWRRPALWAYVQDLLEAVAWEMRLLFGAVSVLTDGYVFGHRDLADDAVAYLADTWSLSARVVALGEGVVSALGSWRIGEESHGEVSITPGPRIDTMSDQADIATLRSWHTDAVAYRKETPKVQVNGLDIAW